MSNTSIENVKKEIQNKGAKWSTVDENLSKSLESSNIKNRLGLTVNKQELENLSKAKQKTDIKSLASEYNISSSQLTAPLTKLDWRNFNGQNTVTSIKNQLGCGSCVAFGVHCYS